MKALLRKLLQFAGERSLLFISAVFVLSRIVFFAVGIRLYTGFFNWGPQLLDVWLLKNNLWESLWYMHGQPPLFNLFVALVLKAFSGYAIYVFHFIFIVLGWLHAIIFYKLLYNLKINKFLAVFITIFFTVSPAAILYENFFYYTQAELFLLTLAAWQLQKFLSGKNTLTAFYFFMSMALLVLTRSMFHWFWIVAVFVGLLLIYPSLRKKILIAALLPLLLSGGWFFKNYVLFGKFASSTWLGMSLSHVAQPTSGIAALKPWQNVNAYSEFIKPNKSYKNVEVLHAVSKRNGKENLNHIDVIQVSDMYLKADLQEIKNQPGKYIKNVARAHWLFLKPSANYDGLSNNRYLIRPWVNIYDLSFPNVAFKRLTGKNLYSLSLFTCIAYLVIAFFSLKLCIPKLRSGEWRINVRYGVLLFMVFTCFYIDFVGNFFEFSENQRFRFITIPTVLAAAGMIINHYLPRLKHLIPIKS